jgi:hypothetical protein
MSTQNAELVIIWQDRFTIPNNRIASFLESQNFELVEVFVDDHLGA